MYVFLLFNPVGLCGQIVVKLTCIMFKKIKFILAQGRSASILLVDRVGDIGFHRQTLRADRGTN